MRRIRSVVLQVIVRISFLMLQKYHPDFAAFGAWSTRHCNPYFSYVSKLCLSILWLGHLSHFNNLIYIRLNTVCWYIVTLEKYMSKRKAKEKNIYKISYSTKINLSYIWVHYRVVRCMLWRVVWCLVIWYRVQVQKRSELAWTHYRSWTLINHF